MMNILLFGGTGTLGSELVNYIKIHTNDINLIIINHDELDLTSYGHVKSKITDINSKIKLDFIINCTAITDTVSIEKYDRIKNVSYMVNSLVPKYISYVCNELNIKFIHFSTDYVFSEYSKKTCTGYDEFPVNIYGYHKLIGELFIKNNMDIHNYMIIRIGWIYGVYNERSFIHKFIKNVCTRLNNNEDIYVIDDQISTPTSTLFISEQLIEIINDNKYGTLSILPSGVVTKYDYAMKILYIIQNIFNIEKFNNVKVFRSKTDHTNIQYPLNSSLHKFGGIVYNNISWEQDLLRYMIMYKNKFIQFIDKQINVN